MKTLRSLAHPNLSAPRAACRTALGFGLVALLASATSFATTFAGSLSGPAESPPNASPGTGSAVVSYDATTHMLTVNVSFSGLTGTTTASHIHCCTAVPNTGTIGVATQLPTFGGFPLGVTSGTYLNTFDLTLASSFNPAFVTANGGTPASAEAALIAGMAANKSYLNIHSTAFPGGEIRSFLTALAPPVPAPALSLWLMAVFATALFAAAMGYLRKRKG